MRKQVAAMVAAVLMAAGLVVASGGSASAQCTPDRYAGCFRTVTKVSATKKIRKGSRNIICVTVTPAKGSARPVGTITILVRKKGSSRTDRHVMDYVGARTCVVTRKYRKRGRYDVTATYRSPNGSAFYNSLGRTAFKVKKR